LVLNRRSFLVAGTGAALLSRLPNQLSAALQGQSHPGADIPWTTYLAQEMKTTGTILGPQYGPFHVETESSHQKCVKLTAVGEYVEFTVQSAANAMVVRYCLPDSPDGGGIDSTVSVFRNGKLLKQVAITSKYSWLYGKYPFTQNPKAGKPRNFYNELRLKGLAFAKGDVVRLQKDGNAEYCIVDLVDLENIAPPLRQPAGSLSLAGFGADGTGQKDDTEALRKCIAVAAKQGKPIWVPAGEYKLTGDIDLPSDVTLHGAGMWNTTFAGDDDLYAKADRRVRFKLTGKNIHLSDFAIVGKLNYRSDREENDGILGQQSEDCTLSRLWVEHTKCGMWFYSCNKMVVDGCRFRNTIADGINLCQRTRNSIVQNCTTRNTGDDCFAIWPAAFGNQPVPQIDIPGSNVIRHCTGQMPFLANGGAIYGGANNRIEDCLFTDISAGCGILLSTTFPTANEKLGLDNNFSGTTVVRNCDLIRCGGFDHEWDWRAAFQLCLDRRAISGVDIANVNIKDSLSDGFSVLAPGSKNGQGKLSAVRLDRVNIPNYGIGTDARHGLWIRNDASGSMTVVNSKIVEIKNESASFKVLEK
jgi:hypothetical protein